MNFGLKEYALCSLRFVFDRRREWVYIRRRENHIISFGNQVDYALDCIAIITDSHSDDIKY